MRHLAFFVLPLAAAAAPTLAEAQAPDAAPVVAAERAFAADALAMGITGSFTKWSVPDAVVISDGRARTVREVYPPDVPRPADEPLLAWWPNFAGVSVSGDLGFTTGAVEVQGRRTGHYVTVWARQDDGSWKWIYDGGNGSTSAGAPGPDSEPRLMAAGQAFAMTERVVDELLTVETFLALTSSIGNGPSPGTYADDAVLYVGSRPPAIGREAITAALAARPADLRFGTTEGATISEAGDLGYTFGPARWTDEEGRAREGHYVRIWRWSPGWRMVLDQLIPAPIAAPPPAAG